ncbi:hypothetical protein ACS0TY_016793 [Phlomoides rotata]
MAGITQDWEPVVIRKKAPTAAARKDEKAVNAARRSGAEIETVKKSTAGTNKAAKSTTTLNTRKLDEETEVLAHEKVPTELKKAIMQGRTEKKLTQAQLAQVSLSMFHPFQIHVDTYILNMLVFADHKRKAPSNPRIRIGESNT